MDQEICYTRFIPLLLKAGRMKFEIHPIEIPLLIQTVEIPRGPIWSVRVDSV